MSRRLETVVLAVALLVAATATSAMWTRGDLPFESVYEVAAHPTLPAIAFAATASGVYRTTDAGLHWQHVSNLNLASFAFNPFRDVEVCARDVGQPWDSAACSVDLGLTWSRMPVPGITFLLFDRSVPDRMYSSAPYGPHWIYVSKDHGKTWTLNGNNTNGQPFLHASGASDLGSNLYVTAFPHGGSSGYLRPLYRSRDGGNTWEAIPIDGVTYPWEPVGPPNRWIVATDPSRRSTLYFACCGKFRASNDGGTTWETRGNLQVSADSLAADPANSAILYVGGESGSVIQSLDGGWNWLRIDGDQIHQEPKAVDYYGTNVVHGISVGADGIVYAATTDAVFTTKTGRRRHAAGRH
jgi:photosystem II stability/assembly factor-like uncharacterized protein